MRYVTAVGLLFLAGLPLFARAAPCSPNGFTVEYINGMSDTLEQAKRNTADLQFLLGTTYKGEPLAVQLGYNPKHISGAGDAIEAFSQMLFAPISDFDSHELARQVARDDATQKLLLVGHSQGALYGNSLYDYATSHGVPPQSIAAYAIATPASYVAGGGMHFTSNEDAVIYGVRSLARAVGAPEPLPSNADLPGSLALRDLLKTHEFATYLAKAGDRIGLEIHEELDALASGHSSSPACVTAPAESVSDKIQGMLFGVADPLADAAVGMVSAAVNSAQFAYAALGSALAGVGTAVARAGGNPAAPQNAEKNFEIVKKLYGSSIDRELYEELNMSAQKLSSPQPARAERGSAPARPAGGSATSTVVQPEQKDPAEAPTTTVQIVMPGPGGSGLPSPFDLAAAVAVSNATDTPPVATSTPEEATSTQNVATSTDPVATTTPEVATSTPATSTPPTVFETSPVYETFDEDSALVKWQAFGDDAKMFAQPQNPGNECKLGQCAAASADGAYTTLIPRMYLEVPPATESGAMGVYARARAGSLSNPMGEISVCEENSGCAEGHRIDFPPNIPLDNQWHHYYFAWRQGSQSVESCILQDDSAGEDCAWTATSFPAGTKFDGVGLWSGTGFRADLDANLWFDELVPAQ